MKSETTKKSTYSIIDEASGTVYRTVTESTQDYIAGEHFWKTSLAFFDALRDFDRATIRVVITAIENVTPKDNTLYISYASLSKKSNCAEKTVYSAIALMERKNIIVNIRKPTPRTNGIWMLNPYFLVKKSTIRQKIMEGFYDQYKGVTVGKLRVVDEETGEVFSLPKGTTPENVEFQENTHFLKVYSSFFKKFPTLSNAELNVFVTIITNNDWANNDVHLSVRDLAEMSGVSVPTVSRAMQKLRESEIITPQLGISHFAINPEMIAQGKEKKRYAMMYDIKKAEQKNQERAEKRKAAKKKKEEEQAADTAQTRFPVPPIPLCLRQKLEQSELPAKTATSAVVEQTEQLKYPVPEYHAPVENSATSSKEATQQPYDSQDVHKNWVGNFPVPGGGIWQPKSEEKPQQMKFVPFIPAAMQKQMAEEERKRKEEMLQESSIDISTVPYDGDDEYPDDAYSDDYVPPEYTEANPDVWDDEDETTYTEDDDDLPF